MNSDWEETCEDLGLPYDSDEIDWGEKETEEVSPYEMYWETLNEVKEASMKEHTGL